MRHPLRSSLLTLCAAAGAIGLLAPPRAALATVVTLNPGASAPALTTSGSSQFTADGAIVSDYVSVNIKPNGNFTESGILPIKAFTLNGAQILPPGYLGQPGATPSYSLYLKFQASGAGASGGNGAGARSAFNSLNYFLYADRGNDDGTISVQNQPTGVAFSGNTSNDVILGIGSLISGDASLSANTAATSPSLLPDASVLATFTPVSTQSSFFTKFGKITLSLDALSNGLGTVTETSGASNSLNLLVSNGSDTLSFGGSSSAPPARRLSRSLPLSLCSAQECLLP